MEGQLQNEKPFVLWAPRLVGIGILDGWTMGRV
jgi:hypothetical protein